MRERQKQTGMGVLEFPCVFLSPSFSFSSREKERDRGDMIRNILGQGDMNIFGYWFTRALLKKLLSEANNINNNTLPLNAHNQQAGLGRILSISFSLPFLGSENEGWACTQLSSFLPSCDLLLAAPSYTLLCFRSASFKSLLARVIHFFCMLGSLLVKLMNFGLQSMISCP